MKSLTKMMSLMMAATILVLSCGKTDTAPSQASLLLGGWPAYSFERTGCTDVAKNEALNLCTSSCEVLIFTATTLTIVKPMVADQVIEIAIKGNTITSPTTTDVITFLVSGTTLTITSQSPATGTESNCKSVSIYRRNPQ